MRSIRLIKEEILNSEEKKKTEIEFQLGDEDSKKKQESMLMSLFHPEDDTDLEFAETGGEIEYVSKLIEVWLRHNKKLNEKFLKWAMEKIRHSMLRHKIEAEKILLKTYYKN